MNLKGCAVNKYDDVMMTTAGTFAELSYCEKRKVGAVLVRDNRIISTGYNGTISGDENECEEPCSACHGDGIDYNGSTCDVCDGKRTVTKLTTVHAEQNIITHAAKYGIPTNDCILYVTTSPCEHCAKLIIQAGIKKVIYKDVYKSTKGIKFLEQHNVKTLQYT